MSPEGPPQPAKENVPVEAVGQPAAEQQAATAPAIELQENQFEDFARAAAGAYNALIQVEVLDQNSFYELGVGLRDLNSLLGGGTANAEEVNRAMQLIDSGIQKITNIPSKMFTQTDFEWLQTAIVSLKRTSEVAGDVFRLINDRGIGGDRLYRTLSSIADAAARKSVGLAPLADAMEGYFSTRL